MTKTIRIVIADDHGLFREGVRSVFRKQKELEIVAEASNGKELVNAVKSLQPDVVLTDIKMPLLDGIEATKAIKAINTSLPVIALSMYDEDHLIIDMLEAGARGYLLKNAHKDELCHAIKTVYNGGEYYCAATSLRLVRLVVKSKFNPYKPETRPNFSQKEIEVIKLVCEEHCTKEIAQRLATTSRSVERFRERIQEKIGAKNVVGIVVYAIRHRIFLLDK